MVAWLSIRHQSGIFVLRIEDLDPPRTVQGCSDRILDDLRWLGFDWDEGPGIGGPFRPYTQSERSGHYEQALRDLNAERRLFPSTISRSELAEIATAPHVRPSVFPASHRPASLDTSWFEEFNTAPGEDATAIRFKVQDRTERFSDIILGDQSIGLKDMVGDFVVKRKDGLYAYQLAVAVDDALMGITEVLRGADLVDSTFCQIQLLAALGYTIPAYGHLPLLLESTGDKMSKRAGGLTVETLRRRGVSAEEIIGLLAGKYGLKADRHPCSLRSLVDGFDITRLSTHEVVLLESDMTHLSGQ